MWIHDVVPDLELDVLERLGALEVFEVLLR
jgi:hypothetical protein